MLIQFCCAVLCRAGLQLSSRDGKVCYYYNRDGTVYERLVR